MSDTVLNNKDHIQDDLAFRDMFREYVTHSAAIDAMVHFGAVLVPERNTVPEWVYDMYIRASVFLDAEKL